MFIEAHLALVEFVDLALHRLKLGPGLLRASDGIVDGRSQPGYTVVNRLHARTAGLHLTGQPGQAFAPVSFSPDRRQMRPLGLSGRALFRSQLDPGGIQRRACFGELGEQAALLFGHPVGLGVERVRVRTGAGGWLDIEILLPLTGDAHRGAHPLGQRREPEPGLLSGLGARRQRGDRSLIGGKLLGCRRQPCGRLVMLAAQGRLDIVGAGELRAPDHQVVGGQPKPGVTQIGLNGLRAPRHFGLTAQRLELSAQFGGQVGQSGKVGGGGVQLAERLLLALAMFEDAGGFLDECTPILRAGLEDLRESALPHDHVHLAADTGVTEQFLNVHQAAATAVDLVLAGAVPEHPSGDRHLGVVDRQHAVGVVDGEGDLGTAEWGARGGAGEDDVFHLAAAQGLGALLAHDPGQGVDDIGFTGSVGSDHAGDTRLEAQSRRRCEGLEALERQTLEVHVVRAYRRRVQRSRKPDSRSPGASNSATTVCTDPGVAPPRSNSRSRSQAGRGPWATTSTRPSG